VGEAVQLSGVKREHMFITSKVNPRFLGYWNTLEMFKQTLKDLRTDYVDLMLIHYPYCWTEMCGGINPEGTWQVQWHGGGVQAGQCGLGAGGGGASGQEQCTGAEVPGVDIWILTSALWVHGCAGHVACAGGAGARGRRPRHRREQLPRGSPQRAGAHGAREAGSRAVQFRPPEAGALRTAFMLCTLRWCTVASLMA
jgi:hypothetical protein